METISNTISHSINMKKYFGENNICFIDIETTGLNRNNSIIYLIGVLHNDKNSNNWILNQYFASNINKEKDILKEFVSNIHYFDKIVTFNGDAFDIPFIEHRLKHNNIEYIFDKSKSFNLYKIIKKNSFFLNLPNLKLKTIENSLGFIREDKYTGYDCIGFYYEYLNSREKLLKENILRHNYDDLVHMLDIIGILDVLDEKKSFYIDIKGKNIKFNIDHIEIFGDMMNISGNIDTNLLNNIKHYGKNYSVLTNELNQFTTTIEFKSGYITKEEKCIYIDTSEFKDFKGLNDSTEFKLPANIFVLTIEKKYCITNIKDLLKKMFENIL